MQSPRGLIPATASGTNRPLDDTERLLRRQRTAARRDTRVSFWSEERWRGGNIRSDKRPLSRIHPYWYGPGGALALDAVWLDSLQVERLRPDFNHPTSKLIEVVFGYEQVSLPLDIDELDWTFELKGDQFRIPVAL